MNEQDIALAVSKFLLANWKGAVGSLLTVVVGCVSLTWLITHQLYKKKTEVLELRISHHESNFNQFSTLMEQRLAIAEQDAERLRRILVEKESPGATKLVENALRAEGVAEETPAFSLKPSEEPEESSRIANMIDRVYSLNTLLKVINGLY